MARRVDDQRKLGHLKPVLVQLPSPALHGIPGLNADDQIDVPGKRVLAVKLGRRRGMIRVGMEKTQDLHPSCLRFLLCMEHFDGVDQVAAAACLRHTPVLQEFDACRPAPVPFNASEEQSGALLRVALLGVLAEIPQEGSVEDQCHPPLQNGSSRYLLAASGKSTTSTPDCNRSASRRAATAAAPARNAADRPPP